MQHAALRRFPLLTWRLWHLKNTLRQDYEYEFDFVRAMDKHVECKFRTAIDIGANFGVFTRLLAKQFRTVHAVEPLPKLALPLSKAGPKNCVVHQLALGPEHGSLELFVPHSSRKGAVFAATTADAERLDSMKGALMAGHHEEYDRIEQVTVRVEPFDDVFGDVNDIDFVKMDVEGFELNVLQGARRTLAKQKPVMLIESEKQCSKSCDQVWDLLDEIGLKPFYFRDGQLKPTDKSILDAMAAHVSARDHQEGYRRYRDPDYIFNFIFAPPEKVLAAR